MAEHCLVNFTQNISFHIEQRKIKIQTYKLIEQKQKTHRPVFPMFRSWIWILWLYFRRKM